MIFDPHYLPYTCTAAFLIPLIIIAFPAYGYLVNAIRPANDPKKREYSACAIFLAPITIPFLLGLLFFIFVIKALLFGLFLVVFTLALIGLRKPFVLVWLDKIAKWIGEPLLEINTYMIKLAFSS